jgi:hypothetical protein
MAKTRYQQKRLNVYACDGDITIHGDIHVGAQVGPVGLTPAEHKKLVARVIRGIPKMLEGLPYTDFGIDNISISKRRG